MNTATRPATPRNTVLLATAYLAPVDYYRAMATASEVWIEACEHYTRQTYRNRCRIATANGPMNLTVPVEKPQDGKTKVKDVKVAHVGNWQAQHWRAMEAAYRTSPFFDYYEDDFRPIYEKRWTYLWDLNEALNRVVIELLELDIHPQATREYKTHWGNDVDDLREAIHPKKTPLCPTARPYYQVFAQKHGFQAGLSVADLLFNMGNEALPLITNDPPDTK